MNKSNIEIRSPHELRSRGLLSMSQNPNNQQQKKKCDSKAIETKKIPRIIKDMKSKTSSRGEFNSITIEYS